MNFNPAIDFHTYAIEWTPDYVAWFIDGDEVYRQTGEHIGTLNKPQKIMMNIWNPVYKDWVGSWDDRILPLFAYYDFVSYASYTPGTGNTGTGNNFTLKWKDDFDNWNQSRWQKATHTFEGNNCEFTSENIVFMDGKMILCLTDNNNIGYVDHNPPAVLWARAYDDDTIELLFSEEVEQESAEDTSNYVIQGTSVSEARLQSDNRTVKIFASNLDFNNQYNLVVLGIKDKSEKPNNLMGQVISIIMSSPLSLPIKINVGGSNYNDYLPDQEWSEKVEYGFMDGSNSQHSSQIHGTDDDQIYRTEHWGIVEYKIRVPNGTYKVTLMMAENYFNEAGSRIFDINVEGEYIARDLDIFQEVGKSTAYNIVAENVLVTDRILNIHFGALKDNALLNGLIIESISTGIFRKSNNSLNKFYLKQNFPNPANPKTTILYQLPIEADVVLSIHNITGQEVKILVNEKQSAGIYSIDWDASNVASGIYFYKIEARLNNEKYTRIKKMLFIK